MESEAVTLSEITANNAEAVRTQAHAQRSSASVEPTIALVRRVSQVCHGVLGSETAEAGTSSGGRRSMSSQWNTIRRGQLETRQRIPAMPKRSGMLGMSLRSLIEDSDLELFAGVTVSSLWERGIVTA
ncbi:unnamed protein product [Protopolystoma xenopodis]|uniref:Uncharacterized protein n=1 Tax=Protopolystoma xenopodis TaxID=117903 RepID=A0A3S5BDP7_9PLAT|nr:unnamed protein product [Protopolystoma xenopodis]